MLNDFPRPEDLGTNLQVRVTAKAAANRIKIEDLPNGEKLVRVYVTAAAEDGKANKEVIKLLAKALGVPQSALSIKHGHTSKNKVISIEI